MKKIRPFFIALLLSCQLHASDSLWIKHSYNFLKDSAQNNMCISCGWAGQTSTTVILFFELLETGRYDLIQDLMFSEIPAVQYMASFTTLYLQRKKSVIPDSMHARRLMELQSSQTRISLRWGCTGHHSEVLAVLLDRKNNKDPINSSFRRLIRESLMD